MPNIVSSSLPLIADLVPHERPMILLDNLISVDEDNLHCQVFISSNSQFYDAPYETVGGWIGIEYMAQAVSAWSGYRSFLKGEASPIGFLLGTRRYTCEVSAFNKNDVLDIYVERLLESEGMGSFSCSIKNKNKILATAQLTVFVPNAEQLEEMLKGKYNG